MIRTTQFLDAVCGCFKSKALVLGACIALSAALVNLQVLHPQETKPAQASLTVTRSSFHDPNTASQPLTETPADRLSLDSFEGSGSGARSAYALDPFARDFALDSLKPEDEPTSALAVDSQRQMDGNMRTVKSAAFYAFDRGSSVHDEIATIVIPGSSTSND